MKGFVIKRRASCTLDALGLASYAVEFDRDGVAVGPSGNRVHREVDAALARNIRSLEVIEVDATEADFLGGVDRAAARLAVLLGPTRLAPPIGRISPPTPADLLEAYGRDIDRATAEAIAEAEVRAARAGLFPYGLHPRVLEPAENAAPAPEVDARDEDDEEDDDASDLQQPATYREAIEQHLATLMGHGGGEKLRALADVVGVKGTSKTEFADGIRAALGDPAAERALFDAIVAQASEAA